jgi:plastocyanin
MTDARPRRRRTVIMDRRLVVPLTAAILAAMAASGPGRSAAAQAAGRGTIKGQIRLTGKLPGNSIIRMGMDPMCARLNAGKRVIQETVAATIDGSLANAFVKLEGTFPGTPVPTTPVTLDQSACLYHPRVLGARVGQLLQVRNSDDLLHNVHGLSTRGNDFNISEPKAGMVQQFKLKDEEILRVKCDVHSWMTAYIGIVNHPYFAVSDTGGRFEIANVPAGTHVISVWQERYGWLKQTVRVRAGATATANFTYTGEEKPAR